MIDLTIYSGSTQTERITTPADWFKYCPPAKGKAQWQSKRSAMEMANFWCDASISQSFLQDVSKKLGQQWDRCVAYPEYSMAFDNYQHPRETDLLVLCYTQDHLNFIISIEGKADESFGGLVADELIDAVQSKIANSNSRKLERIIELWQSVANYTPLIASLRYQLLYWIAGSLWEGKRRQCGNILCLAQEFISDATRLEKIQLNQSDLDHFARIISNGDIQSMNKDTIYGPVFNTSFRDLSLFLMKYSLSL